MKTENKNQFEAPERKHYKKRYLVRKAEEVEAIQEIKTYEEKDVPDVESRCPNYEGNE